ncbi:Fic family protein [Catenibacillus scindens]|uniref:Fic family protein n=1 Tax=Catenibacillus scindens TaxID=673271 RepID=UPI00160FBDCC
MFRERDRRSLQNTQNYISAADTEKNEFVLFTPLALYETLTAVDTICESYNRVLDAQKIDALILIPLFIHYFLCIHPFNDGNGRMSRLLTTLEQER